MWNSLILATVVVLAAAAVPQTRPDFSGKWTSDPEPTASSGRREEGRSEQAGDRARKGDMGSGWSSNITITQDASRLSVEYVFFARGDMQPPLKFVYALDGSETKNSVMMGRGIQVQTSKTAWDGDKLVITTLHTFAHPETGQPMTSEVKHTLSLDSSTSLVLETARSGVLRGPSSSTRTVYRK